MRFDMPIYLQNIQSGAYNPETGNHEQETVTETKRYASVTNAGTESSIRRTAAGMLNRSDSGALHH